MRSISIRCAVSLLLILLILSDTPATASGSGEIQGEISFRESGDTVFVIFRITPENFDADSIGVSVRGRGSDREARLLVQGFDDSTRSVVIYRKSAVELSSLEWISIERDGKRLWISGRVPTSLRGGERNNWSVLFAGWYTDLDGVTRSIREYAADLNKYAGLGMEIWVPSYGYFRSRMASPFDKEGVFLGYGAALEMGINRWRFIASTSWSGLGKNFTFSEPFRLGMRFYSGTRDNFLPQFYGALKLSKLKFKRDDSEYRKVRWGGEFGVAVEGPFERLGYHYSTALGGYHTIELFLSMVSGKPFRAGTRFQFLRSDDISEVRVSFHIEGWHWEFDEGYVNMTRHNNRPFPHKVLATMCFGPAYLVYLPYALVTGKPVIPHR